MPRITLFRVFSILLTFVCLLFLLWFAIPSPSDVSETQRENYNAYTLKSGSELTTVLKADYGWLDAQDDTDRTYWSHSAAIIRWQLVTDAETHSIILRFGLSTLLNLTDFAARPEASLSPPFNTSLPTSDQDGICPPYFSFADASLLNHIISPNDYQSLSIRILTSASGEVQIWKHRQGWENFHGLQDLDASDESLALLAVFSGIAEAGSDLSKLAVRRVAGLVPTSSYVWRKAVLLMLAPIAVALVGLWMVVIAPTMEYIAIAIVHLVKASIILSALIALCFAFRKRRSESFLEWTQSFWMTRWVHDHLGTERKAVIWGTSGPIESNEEVSITTRQATPLRGPADFFRSTSPLDDLLVTFDSTRWMVAPVTIPRRRRAGSTANAGDSEKHKFSPV